MSKEGVVITGEKNIKAYRTLVLQKALRLEIIGLKHSSGQSVYAQIKREFGFKGNKRKVHDLLCDYIEREYGITVNREIPER